MVGNDEKLECSPSSQSKEELLWATDGTEEVSLVEGMESMKRIVKFCCEEGICHEVEYGKLHCSDCGRQVFKWELVWVGEARNQQGVGKEDKTPP